MQASSMLKNDVVTLNVGGRLFSCQRRTLCLVHESLLALMFSGRWPDTDVRDSNGNIFLDFDPGLFESVLNWLRVYTLSRGGSLHEVQVPADKLDHMLAMLDYLQLHRHIPVTYPEIFDPHHHSPFMTVRDNLVRRTDLAAKHAGRHKAQRQRSALMQYAVSDHAYFDMDIEVTLEVVGFHDSSTLSGAAVRSPSFMFIGFIPQAAAQQLDPAGDINTQLTKQPGSYGWLTGGHVGYTVRNGKRSQGPCSKEGLLWQQGEALLLSISCRHTQQHASMSLLNTITGIYKQIEAEPAYNTSQQQSSSNASSSNDSNRTPVAAGAADGAGIARYHGQSVSSGSKEKRSKRPGHRHRQAELRQPIRLLWADRAAREQYLQGPIRELVVDVVRRHAGGVGVGNIEAAELVVAAAFRVLEAQDVGVQAALDILARPGFVDRLVRQVLIVMEAEGADGLGLAGDGGGGAVLNAAAAGDPANGADGPQAAVVNGVGNGAAALADGPGAAAAAAAGDAAQAVAVAVAAATHTDASTGDSMCTATGHSASNSADDVDAESSASTATAAGLAAGVGGIRLSDGHVLPAATSKYEWVLVVGLVHPQDSIRILSARRKGQRPEAAL